MTAIIKITDLHIRGLRGLQKLNLPQDGMGWGLAFPPVAVIGGATGSGKTSLLRCIAEAARVMAHGGFINFSPAVDAAECRIDFLLSDENGPAVPLRFLVGSEDFAEQHEHLSSFGFQRDEDGGTNSNAQGYAEELSDVLQPPELQKTTYPRVVYFPSDGRDLVVSRMSYQISADSTDQSELVTGWQRTDQPFLELLFAARWKDLNAKEQGNPAAARHFEYYTRAFTELSLGEKRLVWTSKGELVVELKSGAQHSLQDLSAGERQALLLIVELHRSWRPGSLILIDDLELHLHEAWQAKIYNLLRTMQAERGGQVIITTQSHALFEMAAQGTRALLGRTPLR